MHIILTTTVHLSGYENHKAAKQLVMKYDSGVLYGIRQFVVAGMCSPSRCLVMNVYSDFTIPLFGRHVTI
jgi:hypothetical protein